MTIKRVSLLLLATLAIPVSASRVDDDKPTLHVVYVAASTCGICKTENIKSAVSRVREVVAGWAAKNGMNFVATGIAADVDVQAGLALLRDGKETIPYDQVIIGGGMFFNEGMVAYVVGSRGQEHFLNDFPDLALPQLLVLYEERHIENDRLRVDRRFVVMHGLSSMLERMPGAIENALDARSWRAN